MSVSELLADPKDAWREFVHADENVRSSMNTFLRLPSNERLDRIRDGLRVGGSQRVAAVRVIPFLSLQERQSLFPDMLRLASSAHGLTHKFRELICDLPRSWVVQRIEMESEGLLVNSSDEYQFEEYRRLLELYAHLDHPQLVKQLAQRALAHPDEDVREAGAEFLERIQPDARVIET